MISFKELELFYKLCKNPHITKLTKEINLTQSAISISLNSLEKKLDEKLFDRVGKKLVLNERGREFYNSTYEHYEKLINAQNEFMDSPLKGFLKLSSSKTFNSLDLSLFIYNFTKNHDVKIQKESKNTQQILDELINSKIDLGFVENDFNLADLYKEKLIDDELILVTSNKELTKKVYFIDQLYSKKWILREKGSATREIFMEKLKYLDEFKITMEVSNFEEIKTILLSDKETITCISNLAVKKELEDKKLFQVKLKNLEFKRALYMAYHKSKKESKLLKEFISFIKESFASFK